MTITFLIASLVVMLLFGKQIVDYILRGGLAFFVSVPAVHYGVKERWGRRTGKPLYEGIHFVLPFADVVKTVSTEMRDADIEVTFTTQDKLQLTVTGTLQYRPDAMINNRNGQNLFIEMSEETVESGIGDALEAKLGALGGIKDSVEFIKNRQAIGDYIDCYLRLKTPPHLDHIPNDRAKCGLTACSMPAGKIDAENVIDFYAKHWQRVREIITEDKQATRGEIETTDEDRSDMENLYGIDAVRFVMAGVNFSAETKAAFEKEKQAEANARGLAIRERTIKSLVAAGLTPQQAMDECDISQDGRIIPQKISVQGNASTILIPAGGIPGLSGKEPGAGKSKKKGDR